MEAKAVRRTTSKHMKKASRAGDVDAYIEAAPREVRAKLQRLRKIIKTTAPEADERIGYGMPYYEYRGRLAHFHLRRLTSRFTHRPSYG